MCVPISYVVVEYDPDLGAAARVTSGPEMDGQALWMPQMLKCDGSASFKTNEFSK